MSDEDNADARFTRAESHDSPGLLSCWLGVPGVILADLTRLTLADGGGCICLYQPPTWNAGVSHQDAAQSVAQARPGQGNAKDILFVSSDIYILPTTH